MPTRRTRPSTEVQSLSAGELTVESLTARLAAVVSVFESGVVSATKKCGTYFPCKALSACDAFAPSGGGGRCDVYDACPSYNSCSSYNPLVDVGG